MAYGRTGTDIAEGASCCVKCNFGCKGEGYCDVANGDYMFGAPFVGSNPPPEYAKFTYPPNNSLNNPPYYYYNNPNVVTPQEGGSGKYHDADRLKTGTCIGPAGTLELASHVRNIMLPPTGEWGNIDTDSSGCTYNSKYDASTYNAAYPPFMCNANSSGMCSTCNSPSSGCKWEGRWVRASRTSYQGDPTTCCFLNGVKTTNNVLGTQQLTNASGECPADMDLPKYYLGETQACGLYTCPLETRTAQGWDAKVCVDRIKSFCANPANLNHWLPSSLNPEGLDGWCYQYMNNNSTVENTYEVLAASVASYFNNNYTLKNQTNAPALQQMLNFCDRNGDACDASLFTACKSITRRNVLDAIDNSAGSVDNQNIVSACACHLAPEQYKESAPPGVDYKRFNSCDPLCLAEGAIPTHLGKGPGAQTARCEQNICVIDDITFDIEKNSSVGGIQFNMICPSIGSHPGGSQCYFTSNGLRSETSKLSNLSIDQACSEGCFLFNPDSRADVQPVNCITGDPLTAGSYRKEESFGEWVDDHKPFVIGWGIIIGLLLIGIIIALLWVATHKRSNSPIAGNPYPRSLYTPSTGNPS